MSDRDRPAELRQLAHDVRNALNGVAVNLEVARSRVQRGIEIAQVVPFMETAAQQLEAASRLHKLYTELVTEVTAATDAEGVRAAEAATDTHIHAPETH